MKNRVAALMALLLWGLLGGEAHALTDGFDYPVNRSVPSPWVWSVDGASTNKINSAHELQTRYSGSGSFTVSRSADVAVSYPAGGGAVYSIQMWDPGTQDLGVLFQLIGPNGWVAIGVNNSVANGKYYFRTDASNGNTGTVIPASRSGARASADWHTFEIYVREDGAYPLVDGIPISNDFRYAPMTSAGTVRIQASWSKPANDMYFDNFSVSTISCPYLTCSNPQIEIPVALYGSNKADTWVNRYANPPLFPWTTYYPCAINVARAVTEVVQGYNRQSFTANFTPGAGWDSGYLYDSCPGADKDLLINYTCRNDLSSFVRIAGEARGRTTPNMDCIGTGPSRYGTISSVEAIYASNVTFPVSVEWEGFGPATSIRDHCLGFGVCDYFVEYRLWAGDNPNWDPARGKDKDLSIRYKCSGTGDTSYLAYVPPEANHRSFRLDCNNPPT